ncbi:hypothetical protein AN219_30750 [Streptomyces nanshensis]|nr:hypothetical protein AN219_30750 [Streptomyces nanshensis]
MTAHSVTPSVAPGAPLVPGMFNASDYLLQSAVDPATADRRAVTGPAGPEELIEFCRDGLAAFKRPREVVVMDELPTTASGKLRRHAVGELAAARLAQTGE